MDIETLTYRKDSDSHSACVEAAFMVDGSTDCVVVNLELICDGIRRYTTERGVKIDLPIGVQLKILLFAQAEYEKIRSSYPIKTRDGWSESGIDNFNEYCKPGEEVDEAMTDYFLNVVPPTTLRASLIQCGEPYSHELDERSGRFRGTFTTFKRECGKWHYCGECFAGETQNRSAALRGIDKAIAALEKASV